MTFEFARKTGRALALTSALVAAASLSVVPSSAYARGWHGGSWHGGGWHRGPGIGLGILGGALVGAAIASSTYPYYYGYPYYSYGYGYPYYSYGPAPYYGSGY